MSEAPAGHRRRSMVAAFWMGAGTYGNVVVTFVVFLVLARLLTPSEFGVVAVATVIVDVLLVASRGGIAEAVVQREDLDEVFADTAFWLTTASGIVFLVLVASLSPVAGMVFSMPGLGGVLAALAVVFVLTGLGAVHEARLQREFGFKRLAARALAANVVSGAVAIGLAFAGWGVWAMVAQRVLAAFSTLGLTWLAYRWMPRWRFDRILAVEQIRFGSRIFASNLLLSLTVRIHELIAALFLSPAAVGYLRMAWRCIDLVSQLTVIPFASVALTSYARLQGDSDQVRAAYLGFVRASAVLAFPSFLGMAATAPVLVPLAFGDSWVPAVPVLQLLCLTAVPFVANAFMWPLLAAMKEAGVGLRIAAVQLAIGAVLSVLVAPFGLVWLALAHVARAYAVWPLGLTALRRVGGVTLRELVDAIGAPLLAAAVMGLVVMAGVAWLAPLLPGTAVFGICLGAGVLVYLAVGLVVMPGAAATILALLRRKGPEAVRP